MRRSQLLAALASVGLLAAMTIPTRAAAQSPASPLPVHPLAQPTANARTHEVAFVTGGDIWVVPEAGGDAHLLVSNDANEARPLYSPDGSKLAFESDRAGSTDLYVLDLGSGELTRVTFGDGTESLDAWSPDGRWLYFATTVGDVGGLTDEYRVSASGGEPVPVAAAAYQPEYFASPSPDGKAIVVDGRARMGYSQWWRNGHAHIDEAELWRVTLGATPSYTRLTEPGTKNLWPMWTPDGQSVLFMSDRSGSENLWTLPAAGGSPRQLTHFTRGRLLWPTLSSDGRTVVFERDFGVWAMALPDGRPHELDVHLRGAAPGPTIEHERMTSGFSDLALSPDGKKVAFIARGEVFAAPADSGGPAERVTTTTAPEAGIAWAPDSRRIAYASRRSGTEKIWLYDFGTRAERALTTGDGSDATPQFSPDGSKVAFVRDAKRLMVADVESGRTTTLTTAALWREPLTPERPLQWSPDGKWLAFLATDARMFENVYVVPADGSSPARALSRLADTNAGSVAWTPDGKAVLYSTGQRTKDGQIARVDLVKRTPAFRETRFLDLFRTEPAPGSNSNSRSNSNSNSTRSGRAASDPVSVRIDFPGIFDRLELLPLEVNAGSFVVSPDGKTLVFQAQAEGQSNLYAWPLDPLASERVARQLTSTAGRKGTPIFTPDGKEVYFLDRGRISHVAVKGSGRPSSLSVTAEMDVDFAREKMEVFDEGWTYLRDDFFDPKMNGADWPAVKKEFAPYIAGAQTRQELARLMNLMVGELNASHLGASQSTGRRAETGRLGLRFDPASLADGRFVIADVVPLGPADVAGITAGSSVTSIDGTPTRGRNLSELLANTVGDLVRVGVADARGGHERVVEVKPVSTGAESQLEYRAWVQRNRAYVDSISGGRLGYVAMPDMGWPSYTQLEVDLDAANMNREGVVFDVRANRGGFVNAYAIDVLARQGYLTMQTRDRPIAPARSILGQRALERPTALVTNLNSLSDAEDFTEGYRALGLGPVVGGPTGGWIIFTWGLRLVDGSSFRMPHSMIRDHEGGPMELHPRPVDITVIRPLGESFTGRDSQLDAAVKALLERIGGTGIAAP